MLMLMHHACVWLCYYYYYCQGDGRVVCEELGRLDEEGGKRGVEEVSGGYALLRVGLFGVMILMRWKGGVFWMGSRVCRCIVGRI